MSKETAIQALKNLQQEIVEKKKSLRPLFEDGLQELFAKYPFVKSLRIGLNNHEFNDGDATHFSLYYEDMDVHFTDDVILGGYENEGEPTDAHKAAHKKFVKFFGEFDVDGFYETLYGDAYESIYFKSKDGKVVSEV